METRFYVKYNKGAQWFAGCETPDQARSRYHKLAKRFHPDVNPTLTDATAIMQEINAHYERDMRGFSGETFAQSERSEKTYTYTYNEAKETGIQDKIVQALKLKMHGVKIELVGSWIWLSGNTKVYKDLLGKNGLGFRWSGKRQMWYYTTQRYRRRASNASFSSIRQKYGSTTYQEAD